MELRIGKVEADVITEREEGIMWAKGIPETVTQQALITPSFTPLISSLELGGPRNTIRSALRIKKIAKKAGTGKPEYIESGLKG